MKLQPLRLKGLPLAGGAHPVPRVGPWASVRPSPSPEPGGPSTELCVTPTGVAQTPERAG